MEIKQVKETCIYVQDLERTENFYSQVLEFPLIGSRPGRHVFFRAGTSVLLCFNPEATKKEDTLPAHYAYGPQHLAFEVTSEDYVEWKEKIQKHNISIIHEQIWRDKYYSFYFHDPDGHLLEIVEAGMWDD